MKKESQEVVLILDNIRSVYNVGAIFRTADALKINKIYLVGVTPAPIDRFGRFRKDLTKSALGAEKAVFWEAVLKTETLLRKLKKNGFKIIALEQNEKAIDYKKVQIDKRTAFILGEEVKGLPSSVLDICDVIAEIEMRGLKESLNVSVATGVALFRILNQ